VTPPGDRIGALCALFEGPIPNGTPGGADDGAAGGAEAGAGLLGAFGLYLAGRSDLLATDACLALSTLDDRGPAASPDAVSDHLRRELGAAPGTLFHGFETTPVRGRGPVQTHRARTADGDRPVEVTLIRPDFQPGLRPDLGGDWETALAAGLPAVRAVAAEVLRGASVPAEPVVEDFRRSLESTLDLAAHAASLDALAREARGDGDLRFPAVERRLSTARVLTVERLDGRRLSDLLAGEKAGETPGEKSEGGDRSRADLARRLHVAWLRLALGGRSVPAEVHADDVAVLADGRIAFLGGPLVRLGPEIRGTLWRYLETASARDPAEAAGELLRWMAPGDESATVRRRAERVRSDRLRHRLRHVVLFRDGGWHGAAEDLAEHLLVQWRLAREAGYWPTPEGMLFVRGLTSIALLGHRLAPTGDPLRAALEHLRLLRGADRLRRAFEPGDFARGLASYATLFAELPGRIDLALGLAEGGRLGFRHEERAGPAPAGRRRSPVVALAVFVALASVALVAFRLGRAGALDGGTEELVAGLVAGFGAALLWVVSRRR